MWNYTVMTSWVVPSAPPGPEPPLCILLGYPRLPLIPHQIFSLIVWNVLIYYYKTFMLQKSWRYTRISLLWQIWTLYRRPFVPRGGSPYYNNLWEVPIAYMKVAVVCGKRLACPWFHFFLNFVATILVKNIGALNTDCAKFDSHFNNKDSNSPPPLSPFNVVCSVLYVQGVTQHW